MAERENYQPAGGAVGAPLTRAASPERVGERTAFCSVSDESVTDWRPPGLVKTEGRRGKSWQAALLR